jgi:hypothetical protein
LLYKSQKRPRTRGWTDRLKKKGQRIASKRRLKENAKKKNRRRESRKLRGEKEEHRDRGKTGDQNK